MAPGITCTTSVARANVQKTIGAKRELTSVVISLRLVDCEQNLGGLRFGDRACHGVPSDDRISVRVGVVDVQRVPVRREGHAEETLFVPGADRPT